MKSIDFSVMMVARLETQIYIRLPMLSELLGRIDV